MVTERRIQVDVDERVASTLRIPSSLARRELAARAARLGGLPEPTRADSVAVLSKLVMHTASLLDRMPGDREETVQAVLSAIKPDSDVALAICVADFGALRNPDPVPEAPEPGWTLRDTVEVALDECLEGVAYELLEQLADAGHVHFD